MKDLPNIDKSAFRKGEYVGYGEGVWRVHRYSTGAKRWRAVHRNITIPVRPVLFGPTLASISDQLAMVKFQAAIQWPGLPTMTTKPEK